MKGHPRQRNQEGYNAPIMDNPLVYPPHTSPYGSFQQQPRMTTEIPQVSPSMGSPYQQNAYQRQAPGNPPFLAHAMPFQTGLPIDQAQTQMVYLSYPNSYPQLIPQIMPQQHQFPAAIPQSRPQFPRYANQSQPFVQPRFSQSNNPAQYFTPFPHTNGQVPLQVPPTTQQPPPQKRERKPLAIVDPNTNEEVSISPDSVSRSRSESTSEGPKQPDNSEQIKVEFAKQVAATIGESPPVDVPSSVESSVVDQQVESELMVPPAFIDTSMPPPLKSAEPTQERPSLLNGVTEELVVPEKKLEEEPAPSIEIEVPNQVPVQDVALPSPLVENEEQEETIEVSEVSSSQVFNSKTLSNPVMPVDPIVDLPVPTVVVEPPPVLEISVAAQEESIPIPQNTIHEPDVEEGKESDFPADSPPESPLPDIEQHENPSVKLIYPYKEGQWSPLNPSGTKKYDTEFLKMIQDSPLAKITPNIPADISSTGPSFKQPASWNQGRKQMNQGYYDTAGADAMSPAYLRSSMQGNRTPLPQRLSQGKGMHRPTTVINIPVAQPKAAFPKVENAWVPDTFAKKKVTDKEEQKTIDLKKAIRGRLNKLTPENYDKISKNILEMEVDTEERLSAIIQIFFDKAVDEPIYAPKYAELCKLMFEKEVPSASGTGKVSFRKLLLDRCQATFEKEKKDEEEIVSKQKALEEADTEEKKKELQMELNERISKTKRIMLGNIRFIGELFKLRMLTIKIMNFCISKLLKSRDEEQLECLCKLISTIGKTYEEEYDAKYQRAVAESKSSGKQLQIQLTKLDVYLDEMKKLSQSEDLSSRIKFMLMDVLDLKQNRWVPRREGEKPKTIDEIRGELEKERLEKELSLQEDIIKQPQMGYPSQRRDGGRGDERKKSRSAVDDGGWQISQGKKGSLIGQDQSSYRPPPRMVEQRKEKQKRERKKDKAEQAQEVCNEERRRQEKQEHRGELLHFEEERQRSPVNPQDAKKYTKEFLKTMRDSPLAKVSPKIPAELSATGPSLELETMGTAWYLESTWSMPQKEMNGLSQGKGGHTSEIAINIPVVQKKGALTPGPLTKQKVVDVQEKQNNTEQRKEKKKRRRKKDKTEEAQEVCNEERKGQEKQEHRGELFLHFEEERKQFEEEKVKFYQDQMKLEKEYTRKSRKMDKRKQDIEKQLHEERNRNERLEMEKEHLRGEQLRLEKELKVFKEEIRKFEQEKVELKREAELKYEQEKKHIEEKWAKELIKHQKQFEDTRKLLEKERIEKVEELEKQLDEEKQRTHDNENQIQQEREKTERKKEVEEQNLYRGLLRLQEERKLFEEEMRKFDQEKIQLEEEAERKNDQEKRLLEERARLVEELKKQLKKEQHFQEEKKRQQEERRKKQQQEEKRREAEEEKRKKAINEEICRIEEERRRVEEEKQQAEEKKIKEEEIRLLKLEEEWLKSKHKEEMSLLEKKRNDALKYIRSQTTHRSLTSNSSLVKNDRSLDETIDADHIEDVPKEKLQKGLNPALSGPFGSRSSSWYQFGFEEAYWV